MANLITGILIGGAAVWLYHLSQGTHVITWFGWLLFTLGAASLAFGVDVFTGSLIEHELQAAWMGAGLFGLLGVILLVTAWQYGVGKRA